MPRPPLPLGTMGEVRCYPAPKGGFKAVAYYRDYDGVTRQVGRVGKTENQAKARLKEACRDRGRNDSVSEITADTTVAALAEAWFELIDQAVADGKRSPSTAQTYRDRLNNQVIPAVGSLRLREVTVSRADLVLRHVREHHGVSVAKTTRTVLSGMFGLAARHDAMTTNPIRDTERLSTEPKQNHALVLDEVWDLRAKIAKDQKAIDWDVVDLVDMMLGTGLRIGETIAITWPALDLDAGTVEVRGTVIRITGQGLIIKPRPKTKAGWRIVELPTWAVTMLRRRRDEVDDNTWGVVFPSPAGQLRDPSNTQGDLRDVFDRAGYPQITSHTFRRTVATLMDEAGLTARQAADQLGHAKVSMTQDHYFGRNVSRTGAAGVLESLHRNPEGSTDTDENHA